MSLEHQSQGHGLANFSLFQKMSAIKASILHEFLNRDRYYVCQNGDFICRVSFVLMLTTKDYFGLVIFKSCEAFCKNSLIINALHTLSSTFHSLQPSLDNN